MKKIIAVLLSVLMLSLWGCAFGREETTAGVNETESSSEGTTAEETTKHIPSVYEMSPEKADTALPVQIEKNSSQLSFSSFEEISAEESYLKVKKSDKILKGESIEYYFLDEENKILALLFDENGQPAYSASYNSENGALEFLGDDIKTWYFNEDGTLNCMVYEYNDDTGYSGVYTFYTPEGERDLVRVGTAFYDGELFDLSEEEQLKYIQKYSHTMEIVSQ
ncbi:MAG: hypothetical protein J6A97_07495 [Clostridia bacterium]|nr:hypothetical protein [Clostridia bacterium]